MKYWREFLLIGLVVAVIVLCDMHYEQDVSIRKNLALMDKLVTEQQKSDSLIVEMVYETIRYLHRDQYSPSEATP